MRTASTITVTLAPSQASSPIEQTLRSLTVTDREPEADLVLASQWSPPAGIAEEARGTDEQDEHLDVVDLLSSTVRRHSDVLLRRLQNELAADPNSPIAAKPQHGPDGLVESLLVQCHTTCSVSVTINELSGLVSLTMAAQEAAAGFERRIQQLVGPVNEGRVTLLRALIQLRTDVRALKAR